jgi:hypothetical protein
MTYLSKMKELRFETSRIVPASEASASRRQTLLRRLQNDMARDFIDQIMSKMDLHIEEDAMNNQVTVKGSLYIASEKEFRAVTLGPKQDLSTLQIDEAAKILAQEALRKAQKARAPFVQAPWLEEAAMMDPQVMARLHGMPPLNKDQIKIMESLPKAQAEAKAWSEGSGAWPFNSDGNLDQHYQQFIEGKFPDDKLFIDTIENPYADEQLGVTIQHERDSQWARARYCLTERGELIMSEQFWNTGTNFGTTDEPMVALEDIDVLVDADMVAYRCAATCDGTHYTIDNQAFGYMKDAKSHADKKGLPNKDIVKAYNPEPVDTALHNVGVMMEKIRGYYLYERKRNPIFKNFLSPKRNFRHDLYPDYKANRKDDHKPYHLAACKDYLQKQFKAFKYDGYEADDLIAMTVKAIRGADTKPLEAEEIRVAIVSNDKDFTQLGGAGVEQYDFTTGKVWTVTEAEATNYFYKQILIGDSADNIPGLYRVGSQTAIKMLEGAEEERDLYNRVVVTYQEKESLTIEEAVAAVQLRGSLLYLMRQENDIWQPPAPRT